MFTEDKIAAAQLAQLFGSELLKVQNSARTDGGQTPHIVNLNPKQFLVDSHQMTAQKRIEEQRLVQMLQAEAEAQCPLPPPMVSEPQVPHQPIQQSNPSAQIQVSDSVLQEIANNLGRIATCLEARFTKQ